MEPVEIKVGGMHCTNCAAGIENHLRSVGVPDIEVNFSTSSATFTPTEERDVFTVVREIQKLGYTGHQEKVSAGHGRLLGSITRKFYFSLFWTIPLFIHTFIDIHFLHNPYLQLALCLPVFLLGLSHFGLSALLSIKRRSPNMDVLIVTGISAAFVYSFIGTIFNLGPNFLFYETAATITTLVFLGNLIEAKSVKRTTSAIEELARLQASKARLIKDDNETLEVEIANLKVGDNVLVNTGDKIPSDGEVYWGEGLVNEAAISGESLPVEKKTPNGVFGGTVLVDGSLKIKVTAVAEHTLLSAMIRLVKEAQRSKPAIQRVGDQVSAVFVPIVVGIALLTFLIGYFVLDVALGNALMRSIAVLVIACPCAMGLATPTAIMVAIGEATRHGILIKGGDTLEKFSKVERIVFDKTGTLTQGEFQIRNIESYGQNDKDFIKSVLLGLERHSSHPIANSLVRELNGVKAHSFKHIEERKGFGVIGTDETGRNFKVGSKALLTSAIQGKIHDIYLLLDNTVIAGIDIEDKPKPTARETLDKLKEMGLKTVLLSGDRFDKCKTLAEQVGIEEIFAEKLPHEKLEIITALEKSSPTAFVGDGINDAAALSKATVGVSLSDATEAAIQSAQIVLLKGKLEALPEAVRISRRTLRTIKQNLFWAFFYNVLAIPIAARGLLNPMIACLAMAFSDVIVVGNSLRLRKWR